jgi:hypothetical protein
VYIAHNPLIAVDAQTGKVFRDTKYSEDYQPVVAIDEEKRMLFATHFSHIYAFKIEK